MQNLHLVICDNGDGSQSIEYVMDQNVLNEMRAFAATGDSKYASGDGLQVTTLRFDDSFDLQAWMESNRIRLTTEAHRY